ncbi:MAG: bifunctional YncE family protein/alkaline phosphatase family protein [Bryobacteraceae bacterium]
MKKAILVLVLAAAGFGTYRLISQPARRTEVGPQSDGSVLLNSGWSLRPAGRQIQLDTFPMSSLLAPGGAHLLVLNQGYNPPSISVLDTKTEKETQRVPVPDGWLGLAMTKDGKRVYVGGGSKASVYEFAFDGGKLTPARTFEVVPAADRAHSDFLGDVAFSPDERLLYVADLFHDRILVINPQSGRVIERYRTGRRPYRILFHPDGKSYFVTSWADGAMYQHDATNGAVLNSIRLGAHTSDAIWAGPVPARKAEEPGEAGAGESPYIARIFVAASNTNRVYSVGITANREMRMIEAINVAMMAEQPLGMTPSALAMDAERTRLYIVCSDANALAAADIRESQTRVLGFVPTAWYPTGARVLPGGRTIVFNGRGPRSFPNPHFRDPTRQPDPLHRGSPNPGYVGRLQIGTASVLDPLSEDDIARHTRTVFENTPYRDKLLVELEIPAGNPVPPKPDDPSPIQHVIYIVKENRTYDQVLGDLGKGNSDPSLCLFPEKVTPNQHKLAKEFVLLDNFYVNSDVSADGHNWSTAAIAPDYVQKMWPNSYGGRRKHYDYEGGEPAALPPSGFIWTQAAAAGLSVRNYGYYSDNRPIREVPDGGDHVKSVRDPVLAKVTDRKYRAYDLEYPDVERARRFIADLKAMEASGEMARFTVLRLGNDHTYGTSPGKIAPLSQVADNDLALGMIVEACSRSRFWEKMAIFVLEDDAQNGADHVDSHRSPAFVLSPYTRRGIVDSTMYNTTSMLRTMELILGLRPMTHFDAAATPMWAAFANTPNLEPYTAEKARIPLDTRNPTQSATAARSAAMDFSEADMIDDDELNDILWRAIRSDEPPPPVRSYFAR